MEELARKKVNYTCPACGCVLMMSRGKLQCTNMTCYYIETCSDGGCGEGIEGRERESAEGREEGEEDRQELPGSWGFTPDGEDGEE